MLGTLELSAQTPYLVADLNTSSSSNVNSSTPFGYQDVGGVLYFFTAINSENQFWKYAGGQATQLAQVSPRLGTEPGPIVNAGNGLIFLRAQDTDHGGELWRTDGTSAGTVMVKDIDSASSSAIGTFWTPTVFQNKVFFLANDGVHGNEPWFSDGTAAGTQLLLDLDGTAASSGVTLMAVLGNRLLIFAGGKMWASDGTTAGTSEVATVGSARAKAVLGSTLFFAATGTGSTGRELWKTDGTAVGTQMVADIAPGTTSGLSSFVTLAVYHSTLYFGAAADGSGFDLWKSDGTAAGTQLVVSLIANGTPSYSLTVASDLLYVQSGTQVWRSDGTAAGTTPHESSSMGIIEAFGQIYYFRSGNAGYELWKSDGTAPSRVVQLPSNDYPRSLTSTGGKLYFTAAESLYGKEPWVCEDGTAATTHRLANLVADGAPSATPLKLTAAGNLVFFTATDGIAARELWRSDGSASGTFPVTSLATGTVDASISLFAGWNGSLFFRNKLQEFWRSDGSAASTALVKNFDSQALEQIIPTSRELFLNGPLFSYSTDLWHSDGTAAGTTGLVASGSTQPGRPTGFSELAGRVYMTSLTPAAIWVTEGTSESTKPLLYSPPSGALSAPVCAAGAIYYVATTTTEGSELWRSDGSVGGEALVKDIVPGAVSSNPDKLKSAGRYLYFVADDGASGLELWRSDGTAAGTILLKDIAPGTASSSIGNLTAAGDLLYFTANDFAHGTELWRSDGTPAGTEMVADLQAGSASSYPQSLAFVYGTLWFSADDGVAGYELWKLSDGTPVLVADLEPGPASSSPAELVQAGSTMFFSATTSLGRELWAISFTDGAFSIGDAWIKEGTGGTRTVRFPVTRIGNTSGAASVAFQTRDGSASSGPDYVTASGILTFVAGETSKFIDVVVQSDAEIESNETFHAVLSAPAGAMIDRGVGTAIIEDDDHRAELSIAYVPGIGSRTFRITNAGPSAATNIQFRISESPGKFGWSIGTDCTSSENPAVCTFSTPLAAGASMLVVSGHASVYAVWTDPAAPPGQTVTASVSAAEPDNNPANNQASVMSSSSGYVLLPAFLTTSSNAVGIFFPTGSQENAAYLTSSNPNVSVTDFLRIPPGQTSAEFTLTTGSSTGTALLTVQPTTGNLTVSKMVVAVVAPGTVPKLDVAITAAGSNVYIGSAGTVTVEIAARRHDGTRPSGTVDLLDYYDHTFIQQQNLDANAAAVFTVQGLPVGSKTYRLRYNGDANFNSFDGGSASITVDKWRTQITLVVPPHVCDGAQKMVVFVRSSVTANAPTGSVELRIGNALVSTVPVSPTGVAGESRGVLSFTLNPNTAYAALSFVATGSFESSNTGQSIGANPCVPLNLQATATSVSNIALNWTGNGAHHYDVYRYSDLGSWQSIGSTSATNFVDSVNSMQAYLYVLCSVDAAGTVIGWSVPDLAMTMFFDDDPIVAGVTRARAAHIDQLRIATNGLRTLGSISTNITSVPIGSPIRATDITALRAEISNLRLMLGLTDVVFTDPTLAAGQTIKAVHVQQLRNALK